VAALWSLQDNSVWLVAPVFGFVFFVVAMGFGLILPAQVMRVLSILRASRAPRAAKG
jgi:hypothetical protein